MGRGVASDPPQIKPPLWAAQVHRTVEDLTQEGGRWWPICQSPKRHAGEGECTAATSGGRSEAAPEGTQSQWGGQPRSALRDPT